jgi:hypothetical protein
VAADLATLKAQASQYILSVRALERARMAAIATGQPVAADGLKVQVINTGRAYNDVVRQLQLAEPKVTWLQLAHVDDLVIPGAAGTTMDIIGDVGQATKSPFAGISEAAKVVGGVLDDGLGALKGALNTVRILPVLLVGALIVAGIYFYRKGRA